MAWPNDEPEENVEGNTKRSVIEEEGRGLGISLLLLSKGKKGRNQKTTTEQYKAPE